MKTFFVLIFFFLLINQTLFADSEYQLCGCSVSDKDCLKLCQSKSPADKMSYPLFADLLRKPLDERFAPASPEILSYIYMDNLIYGYPGVPKQPVLSEPLKQSVRRVLRGFPPKIKNLIDKKLAGVFLIEGLGSTGFSPPIYLTGNQAHGGFIILDVDFLKLKANERVTYRENTVFDLKGSDYKIEVKVTDQARDTVATAIEEILTHEVAHIITFGTTIVPLPYTRVGESAGNYFTYFDHNWKVDKGELVHKGAPFYKQKEAYFYQTVPPLKAVDVLPVYESLEASCYPSLIGAAHHSDSGYQEDFAEAFTHYLRWKMGQHPFSTKIYKGNALIKQIEPFWKREGCQEQLKYMEQLTGL